MTTSAAAALASRQAVTHPLARAVLAHATLLGVAADALLREGPVGIAFPVWIALVALALVALAWRDGRAVPSEARAWLATAVLFSLGVVWRDAGLLQAADVLVSLASLALAAVALASPAAGLFAPRLRDTVQAAVAVARRTAAGILPLALPLLFSASPSREARSSPLAAVRAAGLALVLLLVFGSLLRGADPIFASLVTLPAIDAEVVLSHLFVIGLFTWIAGGWVRAALDPAPAERLPARLPFELGALDITAGLGVLNVLFALYLLSQLGWFFGGEEFLRARTGLTAAEYARQGFFQMVWVVLLVVPVLMVSRAAMRPSWALSRRHTMLALPLVVLLGAMIVSAMSRMRLYVHYFGYSIDRVYPMAFMAWLFIVLAWLAITVLRDRDRAFVGGAVISGLAMLLLLHVAAPDALVARANVGRARTLAGAARAQRVTDRSYLAELGGEAAPFAISAAIEAPASRPGTEARRLEDLDRCAAADRLLERWGPGSRTAVEREQAGWRRWNAGESAALAAVRASAGRLRAVSREAPCIAARRRARA